MLIERLMKVRERFGGAFARYAVATLCVVGSGCDYFEAKPVVEPTKIVVAKVGGASITLAELDQEVSRYLSLIPDNQSNRRKKIARLRRSVLGKMIDTIVLEAEAARVGIEVTEVELDEEIEGLLSEYNEASLGLTMAEREINFSQWKDALKRRIVIQKLTMTVVDRRLDIGDEEIKSYYKKNRKDFHWPERVRALQIVVDDEEQALLIWRQLDKNTNFSDMAIKYSVKPEASSGGDLGYFSRGMMPPVIEDAVFALKPGQISEVVKSIYGWHIFKLVKMEKSRAMKLADSKDRIHKILKEQKREEEFGNWLSALKKKTDIKIYKEALLPVAQS